MVSTKRSNFEFPHNKIFSLKVAASIPVLGVNRVLLKSKIATDVTGDDDDDSGDMMTTVLTSTLIRN